MKKISQGLIINKGRTTWALDQEGNELLRTHDFRQNSRRAIFCFYVEVGFYGPFMDMVDFASKLCHKASDTALPSIALLPSLKVSVVWNAAAGMRTSEKW